MVDFNRKSEILRSHHSGTCPNCGSSHPHPDRFTRTDALLYLVAFAVMAIVAVLEYWRG